jgi:two-component system, chemotaxis family, chemotaxis protein CheY
MTDSPAFRDKRILIVDDDEMTRTLIRRVLTRMKISNLHEATGGEQALQHLAAAPAAIDLIICDWNMPGMSGIELFDRVHALQPNLPFLMLTGRADATSVVAAKKAGVPDYIVKPVSPQELKNKISFLFAKGA